MFCIRDEVLRGTKINYKSELIPFVTFVLTLPLFFTITEGVTISTPRQTSNPYTYTLLSSYGYSLSTSSFTFEVKACNDAHIGLLELDDGLNHGQLYEIVIGGWGNSKSVIRSERQGTARDTHIESLLSCSFYRTFRILWNADTNINVQKYTESGFVTILSWTNPDPFVVGYIGVTGGVWADASWEVTISDMTWTTSSAETTSNVIETTSKTETTHKATESTNEAIDTSGETTDWIASTVTSIKDKDDTISETTTMPAKASNCSCNKITCSPKNYSYEELVEQMNNLKKELTVSKRTTSKYIRSKTSASDPRTSAKFMGVSGIVIMVIIFSSVVIIDLPQLRNMWKIIKTNLTGIGTM